MVIGNIYLPTRLYELAGKPLRNQDTVDVCKSFRAFGLRVPEVQANLNGEHIVDVLTYKPPPGASLLDVVKDFRKRERAFGKAVKRYEG